MDLEGKCDIQSLALVLFLKYGCPGFRKNNSTVGTLLTNSGLLELRATPWRILPPTSG